MAHGVPTQRWDSEHPFFRTRVPAKAIPRIEAAMRKRGLDRAGLILFATETILAERLPESQDGLQRVQIDKETAQAAADVLIGKAEELRRTADVVYKATQDMRERQKLRHEAQELDEKAAWFLAIAEGADFRRHVIESGQKPKRHRYIGEPEAQSS